MADIVPFFQGEVQFRRYSDTSTQGQQVVFAVLDRDALAPFIGKEGKRFAAVLVEIGDDEQPVNPRRDQRGPMCREACDYCADPVFQRWAHERADFVGAPSERSAKEAILGWLGIESRKQLDESPQAAHLFIERVRTPYLRWRRGL